MDNITLYNVPDYQSLLESLHTFFENFLVSAHVSAVSRKNYRSDLRDFIGWVVKTIKTTIPPQNETPKSFLGKLTSEHIESYKRTLELGHIPTATINRRLSTLRKFFTAAVSYGVLEVNPTVNLRNVIAAEPRDTNGMLGKFRTSLFDEGASDITVKNYLSDVTEFLDWLSQKQKVAT